MRDGTFCDKLMIDKEGDLPSAISEKADDILRSAVRRNTMLDAQFIRERRIVGDGY